MVPPRSARRRRRRVVSRKEPGRCAVKVTVPVPTSVLTAAPATAGTGAARVSCACGLVGSTPGRSLASGCRVTGEPTTACATSGSAVGAISVGA